MTSTKRRIAGVEGGGTTWVCAIANEDLEILERASFPTTSTPSETLAAIGEWLGAREVEALGVASFGPVDPDPASATYGYITATPKPGWQQTDVIGFLKRYVRVPTKFDTDVNAPAFAEWSLKPSLASLAYVTVGTGVGVGLVVNGKPLHGLLHPEAGHISCPRYPGDDPETSDLDALDCPGWLEVESMTATRALARRAGVPATELQNLPDSHPVWDVAAFYLAAMCANLVLVVSPQKIILSGGVMQRESLFPKIKRNLIKFLNGYIPAKQLEDDDYVAPSCWGNDAGIYGALVLAKQALDDDEEEEEEEDAGSSSLHRRWATYAAAAAAAASAAGVVLFTAMSRRRHH
ncbi:hypothetical protein CTAYLR_004853 [Chrysophaeum taylorii]|uniref:fructokinase n=1 Tax=Chrysophaeum taylorii TaxID=2483200 RepID=A0AAD7UG24_9STRA|nr:hypothetical protein CTAYLR_004853 [Chrysophaeum taylorii]